MAFFKPDTTTTQTPSVTPAEAAQKLPRQLDKVLKSLRNMQRFSDSNSLLACTVMTEDTEGKVADRLEKAPAPRMGMSK